MAETHHPRTLDLDQLVLLNHVRQLFAFVLALRRRLLQVRDLLVQLGKAERVGRAVRDATDKGRVRVLERLQDRIEKVCC